MPTDEPYHVPVDLWNVDWVVRSGHRLGVVVASENAEWAVNDHGHPNRNRVLLSDDPCEPSSRLGVPVSEAGGSRQSSAAGGGDSPASQPFRAAYRT